MSSGEDLWTEVVRITDRRELRPGSPLRKLATKPIRSTVDLPAGEHARVRAWRGETAVKLGRARVTTHDVQKALVHLLMTDETLALAIRDELDAQ
jgi:hypothetical protein